MLSILLSTQFRAYCNDDPKQVQQKALPFVLLDELAKRQVTELDRAVAQLTISAAFFACHSCEYLKVPTRKMKRTKLLRLQNIRFFKYGCLVLAPSDNMEFANSVAVTFEMQKMKSNMRWSSTVRQTTQFCVQFCNWYDWSIGSEHIRALQRILQSAQFGSITDPNR